MAKTIEFEVPSEVISLNVLQRKYRHHMKRNNYYKSLYLLVQTIGRQGNHVPPKPFEKCKLHITVYRGKGSRMLDFDNLVASLKPFVDALTKGKFILDDRYSLTGNWIVNQKKIDGPSKIHFKIVEQ